MLSFFTICWVMWSWFPHWVNFEKNQNNLITIYWAIHLNSSFAIYLISLFIICWVQQMPSFFAVYWVMWSQFTDYVNLKKTRNLLREFNHNLLSHLLKELICSLPDWSITICWAQETWKNPIWYTDDLPDWLIKKKNWNFFRTCHCQ